MMKYFLAENWHGILTFNGLDDFDRLWELDLEKVDRPNIGHGGWSSVSRLVLDLSDGGKRTVYLKRQENYKFRSLVFPLLKVASFEREMRRFIQFSQKGIPVSNPVYYEKKRIKGKLRAILMIENLDGYQDLDRCLNNPQGNGMSFIKRKRLIEATATVIRRLHETGFQHGMLFGKHIFIKGNADFSEIDIRLIDLEFARWHPNRVIKDLTRLYKRINRAVPDLPNHNYIRFIKAYRQEEKLTAGTRKIIKRIQTRINKKKRPKT
jgi:tRNA A-37 threonylcarbamoyl transferase component Bud32